ncbi:hypothetical protein [Chryseobacterium sp. 2R14A]|uniref:hypothetical protein n=1 Tax=Chryseobacterium sp. 2R14A TaxID=3380353 RepID=UPI003CF096FF
MKFPKILLISIGTAAIALFSSFLLLPEDSGYFGLFLIGISPLFIIIFTVWTYILKYFITLKSFFKYLVSQFLLTFLFAYCIVIISSYILSSDNYGYDFNNFKSDTLEILQEFRIFCCIILTTFAYSTLLIYFTDKEKVLK